ncbi:MAG: pyridoxamine 5'-phosphate oxidase family protein [Flavobacteriaceae bacterium]
MGKKLTHITNELKDFIENQKIFFVGTAAEKGRVNISPKGLESFRVLNPNKVVWQNLTGSGNETAAHLFQNDRMTILFCSFDKKPLILRLYGKSKSFHERDLEFHQYQKLFPENVGSRQFIEMEVDLVQTSCGFGVPLLEFKETRNTLNDWANQMGESKIKDYWKNKNTQSIDGFETYILEG